MGLIEVKNIKYSYNEQKLAVNNVSFNIEEGSYTTIIGHNGSGKSTVAKLLAGLLSPKEGEIYFEGVKLTEETLPKIREKLGIVFQNPDNQFIGSTVRDDVAFGLENYNVDPKEMETIINEYVKKVELEEYIDKEPQNLSGGQKQRVAIAGVLAMKPKIIIFDEATSMLDPRGKKEIKKLMYELHHDFTVISITHDIEEVLQSDNCIVLNKGQVYMIDKPENVFKKSEELKKIGLDIPFSEKIKEGLKNYKLKSNDLKGLVDEICQYASNH